MAEKELVFPGNPSAGLTPFSMSLVIDWDLTYPWLTGSNCYMLLPHITSMMWSLSLKAHELLCSVVTKDNGQGWTRCGHGVMPRDGQDEPHSSLWESGTAKARLNCNFMSKQESKGSHPMREDPDLLSARCLTYHVPFSSCWKPGRAPQG